MTQDLTPTPGQTVGPFFHYALPYDHGADLVPRGHPDAVALHGTVLDGAGTPIPDAVVELWQAAPDGTVVQQPGSLRRDGFTFTGWGRDHTDRAGHYSFSTLAPGPVDGAAPFFALTVFARGLLDRLFTRAYLPGAATQEGDFLASVPRERRGTLVAERDTVGFRFDIRLQGEGETVFLSHPRD